MTWKHGKSKKKILKEKKKEGLRRREAVGKYADFEMYERTFLLSSL